MFGIFVQILMKVRESPAFQGPPLESAQQEKDRQEWAPDPVPSQEQSCPPCHRAAQRCRNMLPTPIRMQSRGHTARHDSLQGHQAGDTRPWLAWPLHAGC